MAMLTPFTRVCVHDKDLFPAAYPDVDEKREETVFWNDFVIANAFGVKAVKDTFKRAFRSWKKSYKYATELEIVMNKMCWAWDMVANMYKAKGDKKKESWARGMSVLYQEYYYTVRNYLGETLTGEEATFHFYCLD